MEADEIDIEWESETNNCLKVECSGMSMEIIDPMTITTPDGRIFMIYEDCGKWVLIAR